MNYLDIENKLLELNSQIVQLENHKNDLFFASIFSTAITIMLFILIVRINNRYVAQLSIIHELLMLTFAIIFLMFLIYILIKNLMFLKSSKSNNKLNKIDFEIKSILKNINDEDLIKLDSKEFKYNFSKEIENELVKRCAEKLNIKNKENQKNDFLYEILINKNSKKINIKNE